MNCNGNLQTFNWERNYHFFKNSISKVLNHEKSSLSTQHKSAIVTFVEKPQLIKIDFQVDRILFLNQGKVYRALL